MLAEIMTNKHITRKGKHLKRSNKKERVIITKDMKASQQCQQAYSKANKMFGIINRTVDYKSKEQGSSVKIVQVTCSTATGVLHCCVVTSLQEGQRATTKNPTQIYTNGAWT